MGDKVNELEKLYGYLDNNIVSALKKSDVCTLSKLTEIRVRKNKCVCVSFPDGCCFLNKKGCFDRKICDDTVMTTNDEFEEIFMKMCNYSVYSVMDTLKQGYLTLPNGSRVGVCSTLVCDSDNILSVKDVTSLNIRIPRQVYGCCDAVFDKVFLNGLCSVIIASKAAGGKTTLLRDIARKLSDLMYKVTIVDERNEIAGKFADGFSMDVGDNTDVLTYFPKKKGIEIATRVMSPDVIIFDEIANQGELDAVCDSFANGVSFVLSVHAGTTEELSRNVLYKKMLCTEEFSYLIFISDNYNYEISRLN